MTSPLQWRGNVLETYPDLFTREVLEAIYALAPLNRERDRLMAARIARRRRRAVAGERIGFLDPKALVHARASPSPKRGRASSTAP